MMTPECKIFSPCSRNGWLQGSESNGVEACGDISVADYAFTVGMSGHMQTAKTLQREADDSLYIDSVLQLAMEPVGPWAGLRSMTAIMTVPMAVNSRTLAVEMSMRAGLKCVTLRSLAVLYNSTDVPLDLCVCPRSLLSSNDLSAEVEKVEEEVYENQRFSPLLGWGSNWPGHLLPNDPARYSTRDLGNSSTVSHQQ